MELTGRGTRRRLAVAAAMAALVAAAAPAAAAKPAAKRPELPADVIHTKKFSERQFRQRYPNLPDSAVVMIEGTAMTVAELRADSERRMKAAAAKSKLAGERARRAGQARLRELEQQQANLEADNARALAEFKRLAAREERGDPDGDIAAIRDEARELQERARTATPAERRRLEARAAELLDQLARARAIRPRG